MSEFEAVLVEQLRLALLSDIRTVADALNRIANWVEVELASPFPNLAPTHRRFREIATTLPTRMRLHERVGWPGEPISPWALTFRDWEEKNLAVETFARHYVRVASQRSDGDAPRPPMEGVEWVMALIHAGRIEAERTGEDTHAESIIHIWRAAGGRGG